MATKKEKSNVGRKVIITFLKGKLVKTDRVFSVLEEIKDGKEIYKEYRIPKIKLLNGKIIYGDECWWMWETEYKKAEEAVRAPLQAKGMKFPHSREHENERGASDAPAPGE